MDMKNNNEIYYDAFISYRHSDLDKFVAEELHKQLENFKVPKKISKVCGKKRINRIFRDKDELPITSNLADPIINALRVSEYLVVICSPRLNASMWCKREIENFIAMHGQDKILAVLIEGEPRDSFPPELLYRDRTVRLENGETRVVREAVEPLAADVRGVGKKEIKKNIKNELLRLLAPMLKCNYDDLKQRHKERRMQKILTLASVIGCVGLTFGTVSTIMALQIHNQKEQIDAQYAEIKEQKEQIDKQYWEALETNAIMSSENALEQLEVGDRIGAISMARELLPDELENQDIPYTAEAFYALSEAVYPYASGNVLAPVYQLQAEAEIDSIKLSNDGDKICAYTKYGQLLVWDLANQKKCLEVDVKQLISTTVDMDEIAFLGSDRLAIADTKKLLIFELEDNEASEVSLEVEFIPHGFPSEVLSDSEGKYVIMIFHDAVSVLDADTYEELWYYDSPEDMETVYSLSSVYKDNTIIFAEETTDDEGDYIYIHMVDMLTGEKIQDFEIPNGRIAEVEASADSLFVVRNSDKRLTSLLDVMGDAEVYCYNLETGKLRWQYTAEAEYVNSIVIPYKDYDCFLIESYGMITALNKDTGDMIGQFSYGSSIVRIFPLQTPDNYIVYTRDGSYITFVPEKNYSYDIVGRFVAVSDNVKDYEWGNGFIVCLPYESKELTVYDWYQDPGAKEVFEFDDTVQKLLVSEDGKYSAANTLNDEIIVIDNETMEIKSRIAYEDYIYDMKFIEDNKLQCVGSYNMWTYDMDGTLVDEKSVQEDYFNVEKLTADGKYVYGHTLENLVAINCESGEVEKQLSRDLLSYDYTYVFSNAVDKCVILNKDTKTLNLYNTSDSTLIQSVDINATYVATICFSENDKYVYVVYEDGDVEQYDGETLTWKCTVTDLDETTDEVWEKTVNGETKYFFQSPNGAYVLGDYEGQLKVEQFVPLLETVNTNKNEYWVISSKTLYTFPIYTYEEMLGKADQICYDNLLWNN